ncbi:MAG: hypothetical protein HY784_15815, partial [Chloroflexi bacterium]|nr:hypothetical protein [Chloroflexota bacterium]
MNNRDRDLLQDCLRALESGNSPEEILRHQPPETAARLRSLVEIAAVARGPAPAMPDPQARQRNRAAFLSAATPAPLPARRRFALPGPIASLGATALALALAFAGLTAISRASLPGQMLYPLKRSLEQIEQRLNPQPTELQRRRLQEVQQLLALGITREVTFEGTLTNQTGDTWTVSGIPVLLTASTPIHGAPAVGRLLRVHGATGPNHLVLAFEITALAEAPAETPLPVLSPAPMQDTPPAPDPTPDPAPDPAPDLTRTGADLPGPTPDGRGNPAPTRPTRTPGGLPAPTAAPSGKPPRTPTP